MNANRELERRLHDFYASEAPQRAPDRVLEEVLALTDSTRQRRAVFRAPWRFPNMNTYAKVAIAAVAVIAIGAIGFAVLPPDGQDAQPAAVPSASRSPAVPTLLPSAVSGPQPTQQLTTDFSRPFAYALPTGAEFASSPANGPTHFEVRIPALAAAGTPAGLIVQAIGGGRSDPCSEASAPTEIPAGPRAVFDYLRTIPQLEVTDESATSVGPNAAWQASVEAGGADQACPELWPWAASLESEPFPPGSLRLVAVDVGGEHIVLTVFGETSDPGWDAMADELVGSIRFVESSGGTIAPPLTESFTSTRNGLSMSYPEGWSTQAATAPWTGEALLFRVPPADFLYDPTLTDHLFLAIASQPIGDSTPDEWVAEKVTLEGCTAGEPIAVNGATGLIGTDDCNVMAVTTDGRGYLIWLYTSGDQAWLSATYDRAWFEEVLATVQLDPGSAVGAAP